MCIGMKGMTRTEMKNVKAFVIGFLFAELVHHDCHIPFWILTSIIRFLTMQNHFLQNIPSGFSVKEFWRPMREVEVWKRPNHKRNWNETCPAVYLIKKHLQMIKRSYFSSNSTWMVKFWKTSWTCFFTWMRNELITYYLTKIFTRKRDLFE